MTQLVYRAPPPVALRAIPFPVPAVAAVEAELSMERWDRWVARNAKHDRVVRRRFQIAGGILAIMLIGCLLWIL